MKVKYITEGVFKNPTQAREARIKDKELSNAERLANNVDNLLKRPIVEYLDWVFNDYAFDNFHDFVAGTSEEVSDVCKVFPDYFMSKGLFTDFKGKGDTEQEKMRGFLDHWSFVDYHAAVDVDVEKKLVHVNFTVMPFGREGRDKPYTKFLDNAPNRNKWHRSNAYLPATDMNVFFIYTNRIPENAAKKIGITKNLLKAYVDYSLTDTDRGLHLDNKYRDFFIHGYDIEIETTIKIDRDILIAGITETEMWNIDNTLNRCFPWSPFYIVADNKRKVSSTDEMRRNTIDTKLYPLTKYKNVHRFGIKFTKKVQPRNFEWDKYVKDLQDYEENKFRVMPLPEKKFSGFEELAEEIKNSFKRRNIKIDSGKYHMYFSTGYFEKNYMII